MTTRAKVRGDSDWTAQNIQRLLAAMKTSVSEEYKTCSYIGGMKTIQWENVAFPPFSADACQAKWGEILQKIRKIRSLTELINEAEEKFTTPINQVEQTSEDSLPAKPPSTGYNLFCKEQVKLIKGVSKKSISIVLAQRWKELTQNEKKQYCTRCRELKRRYAVDIRVLTHTQNSEDFLPTKPPSTGYNLFCKEQVKLIKGVSKISYCTVLAQRWKELTVNQKKEYSARCQALKRQYKNDLNCCLMMEELEDEKQIRAQHDTKKITNGKAAKHRRAFAGEPRMPSRYSNHIFLKEEMKRLKNSFPNTKHRFAKINQRWKRLSLKEKEAYREKQEENMAKYSLELKQWYQGLNPQEQKEYLTQNPSKCQYLNCINTAVHEELIQRPSDSEDEDITDDSSTDDLYFDSIESEEEEEEDMDMPFMF